MEIAGTEWRAVAETTMTGSFPLGTHCPGLPFGGVQRRASLAQKESCFQGPGHGSRGQSTEQLTPDTGTDSARFFP